VKPVIRCVYRSRSGAGASGVDYTGFFKDFPVFSVSAGIGKNGYIQIGIGIKWT
jgi:hypothetical protein